MIQATVVGAAGRMGGCNIRAICESDDFELVGACEVPGHPSIGEDVGTVAGVGSLGVLVSENMTEAIERCEVVLDFTAPGPSLENASCAASLDKASVIGTTGFEPEQKQAMLDLGDRLRAVVAPNMSVGVNVAIELVKVAAQLLGEDFDVELVEAHHHFKKDAPSGTALALADAASAALGRELNEVGVYGRHGQVGERAKSEIGVMTLRAGDLVGEHTVMFGGIGERVEIIHRAHSRDNFARGALRAARWVLDKPAGIYSMADVLGLTT